MQCFSMFVSRHTALHGPLLEVLLEVMASYIASYFQIGGPGMMGQTLARGSGQMEASYFCLLHYIAGLKARSWWGLENLHILFD